MSIVLSSADTPQSNVVFVNGIMSSCPGCDPMAHR